MHADGVTRLDLVRSWFSAKNTPSSILVLAPQGTVRARTFLADAPATVPVAILRRLGADASPGDNGTVTGSLVDGKPLVHAELAVLPDAGSRYNSPARAEAVRKCVREAKKPGARGWIVAVLDDPSHALAVANAIGRALPTFDLKSGKSKARRAQTKVLLVDARGNSITPGKDVADIVRLNREAARLVDTPPTDLDPAGFAREARALLRGITGVRVQEIRGDNLLRKKLNAIHAVGRCARSEPRLLIATCGPASARPHIALVGKGLTYDTGGLHLKGRGSMETMKCDMGGAAAVLGAFAVLAKHSKGCRITALLCIAENAIGPAAFKPDDVIHAHSGKTVEINNTDAEGRLVLADGVSYAARVLGADIVLDAATLTGAQMIATGTNHAAVVSNDESLEELFVRCGRASGDLVHPLPFAPEFYRGEFRSPIADLRNSVKNRSNAQCSCAAQFIYEHLSGTEVRWAHVDLAGPAFREDRGTGYGVALLASVVSELASSPTRRRARRS